MRRFDGMAGFDGMAATEVVAVVAALERSGCRVWLEGGWGVDALAGRQTRAHRDLDVAIDAAQEAVVRATSMLDRVAGKGIIHKNNAARRKSRLMAKFNKLGAAQA